MQTLILQGKRTFTLYYKRYDFNNILLLAITSEPASVCFEFYVNPQTNHVFISQLFYQAYPLSYQLLKETVSNNQKLFHQFVWMIKKSIFFDFGF
jgi:hypothetical protein